jgi:hypothetical protein
MYTCIYCYREWVSEWLLFNANLAIFQLYHRENMFIFNEMMMKSALFSGLEPTIYRTRGEHATITPPIRFIMDWFSDQRRVDDDFSVGIQSYKTYPL